MTGAGFEECAKVLTICRNQTERERERERESEKARAQVRMLEAKVQEQLAWVLILVPPLPA